MLKRITFIFITFVLCGAISSAQNINVEQYKKLVDWVNCSYMYVFCQKNMPHKSIQELNIPIENYTTVPDERKIYELIGNNPTAKNRAEKINRLKEKNINNLDNNKIIEQILDEFSALKNNNKILYKCVNNIKINLEEKFVTTKSNLPQFDTITQKNDVLKSIEINKKSKLKINTDYKLDFKTNPETYHPQKIEWKIDDEKVVKITNINDPQCIIKFLKAGKAKITVTVDGKEDTETVEIAGNSFWGKLSMWIIFIILVYFAIKFRKQLIKFIDRVIGYFKNSYFLKNKAVDENTNDVSKSLLKELKEVKEENENLKTKIKRLEKQNKELLQENIELGEKIEIYQYKPKVDVAQHVEIKEKNLFPEIDKPTETSVSVLYADAIIDDFFNKTTDTPNEDTVFELRLQNVHSATFTIYKPSYQRIIARPSFLDGCEKQILINAQNIRIDNEGATQRQADGKWKIIKKLSVTIY